MKRSRIGLFAVLAGGVLSFSTAAHAAAASTDPLQVAPKMYSLQFENEKVRVLQVVFKPGEKIKKHSHPDHFVYVVEAGKLQITKADGSSTENALTVGQVIWIPAESHSAQNTGTTQVKLLVTELK